MLTATVATGCFEDPMKVEGDTTQGSTAEASASLGGTGSTTDPSPTGTDATTMGTSPTSVDGTATEESTGQPLPIQCDDELPAPGELCFGETTLVMTNDVPFSARIGDVAGTPSRDLVYLIADQVVVRVGDGEGHVGTEVFDAAVVGERFELADFDGDDELDLLVAESSGSLRLLLGSGAGSFATSEVVPADAEPRALAVGDLDGDGSLDAVVGTASAELLVVLGDGAGGLQPLPAVASFGAVTGLALADVDGDDRLDLAYAMNGGGGQGVALRRGLGDGTFQDRASTPGRMAGASAVVAGDFDGDGAVDLAYASTDGDALGVLWGDGTGLVREVVVPTGADPSAIVAVDLDNDGHDDLAVGHQGEATLRMFVVEPGGAVVEGLMVPLAATVSALHAGDLDGDGVPDLAATSSGAEIVTLVLSTP